MRNPRVAGVLYKKPVTHPYMEVYMKDKLFLLLLSILFLGAVPQTITDRQLVFSEAVQALYPDEGVCSLTLGQVSDVTDNASANQCLKKNADGTAWVGGVCGDGVDSVIYRDNFTIPTQAVSITLASANTRAFHEIRAFTAPASITTGVVQETGKGIRITADGIYTLDLQIAIELTASGPGEWGISLLRTNGLTGDDEVVHDSAVISMHTERLSSADEDYVESLHLGPLQLNENDYIYVAFSYGSSTTTAFNLSVSPAPLTSTLVIQKLENVFNDAIQGPAGPAGPTGPAGPRGPPGPQGPGAGAETFALLTDTPSAYTGEGGKFVAVKDDVTGLEFVDAPTGGGGGQTLIAIENTPTDLTPYSQGQILPINTPSPGKWVEVSGADAGERHSFRTVFEADSTNTAQAQWQVGTDLNYGYSSFGDVFGQLFTADGGKPFTASNTPVMRMEIEQEVATRTQRNPQGDYDFTFNTTYTLLIRKTDLASPPANAFARYYTGPPGEDNQVATVEFMKGPDNPAHNYHTYIDRNGADISEEDLLSITYFNLFTSSPATGDQTTNPLELHESKDVEDFTAVPATWARVGQTAPVGVDYSARSADTTKSLKLAVEETTPAVPETTTGVFSNITFYARGSTTFIYTNPNFARSRGDPQRGSASIENDNLLQIRIFGGSLSYSNEYYVLFTPNFFTGKSDFNFLIGSNSYSLTINSGNPSELISAKIPSGADRVTPSSLTKMMNISYVENGQTKYIFEQTTPGSPESKADTTLDQTGTLTWLQTGIDADIEAKVPQQFRSDATTSTTRFQPKCFEMGTSAQITAITPKVENCFYITLKTGQ